MRSTMVKVDGTTYALFESYCGTTGVPVEDAVGEALADWLKRAETRRVEELKKRPRSVGMRRAHEA